MCGIIGWFGQGYDQGLASSMCLSLKHRGPDSWGEWHENDVWLAHRRLAILDLSPQGAQPMHSPCGRYVLSFNGEIYNYKDLRYELESQGYQFRGNSDSEVMLAACVVWGVKPSVKRFEGMFAFAIYDRDERSLYVARDPMGIKPLYYAQLGKQFAFSSELTPLLSLSWVDKSIDQDALSSYFRYLCVPSPASIINGVKKLQPGSLLWFKNGELKNESYWNIDMHSRVASEDVSRMSLHEAADELEVRLKRSIKQHMQSDVPYGAFLSGGVDSSAVVALMQSESSRAVKTFSIGFSEKSHDESIHARAIAKHLGTDHHELIMKSDDLPGLVPKVAGFFDEPFADNSAIPTYLVSQFARKSVKVCLSGDGGDELFGGYPRYFWAQRIEKLRQRLSPRGSKVVSQLLRAIPRPFWDKVVNPAFKYKFSGSEGLAHRVDRFARYLGCDRTQAYAETMSIWSNPEYLLNYTPKIVLGADALNYPQLSWADEMMLIDQSTYLQNDILTKVDRASMAVSLEARVPLLTHSLVEWAWQLEDSLKLSKTGDHGKLILREVLYRYVPKKLIERPKQGFGMPVGKWLRGPLRDWAESLLNEKDLEDSGLDFDLVKKVWDQHQSGEDHQAKIWTILMYRQWQKNVLVL